MEGQGAIERRNAMEFFRDSAAAEYQRHTGSLWRPRTGSKVSHRALTSAMIDSRDFLAAKRRAEIEVLLPAGPRIVLTGGADYNEVGLIWDKLDKVRARHADMVLLHGGTSTGAELIAARWADARKVPQIAFKPDWKRHAKAAPFKRNDAMLATLPIGVMIFPGSGIQDNLGDKARVLGIPVWRAREERRLGAAVLADILWRHQAYSVAPTGFDILKPSDFEAGIFSGAPVAGLRPSRAGRSLTEKRPNPAMATSSPRLAASMIAAKMELTTSFALALEMSLASATASTSSVVFNGLSFNGWVRIALDEAQFIVERLA